MLPLKYALVTNWRPILLGIGTLPVAVGGYYLVTTFVTAYATDPSVGLSETVVLNALSVAAVVELVATLGVAWLGDRFGRVRVVIWGLAAVAVLATPQFLVLSSGSTVLIFLVFAAMRLVMAATYGPVAAVLSQMFQATGSIVPVVLLLAGMCAVSVACLLKAPQHVDDTTADRVVSVPQRAAG